MNIIAIPVSIQDRDVVEELQGKRFHDIGDLSRDIGVNSKYINIYCLEEFTEMCNNEDFDIDRYWIGYAAMDWI